MFLQLFHEDGECWVYDEPLLKRLVSQRHWEDYTHSDTHTYVCIKRCTHSRVFIRTLLQNHFLSKPWNDWWLNMYTALHLTVKQQYGNEWNQMEKHQRCNMKISKAPLLIWAIPLPPPPIPTNMRLSSAERRWCQHVSSYLSTLSVSFTMPIISSTRQARAALISPIHMGFCFFVIFLFLFLFWEGGEGGVWLMVFKSNKPWQIKQRSTSQGIWWLRKRKKKAAAPSESLTAL